jgi:hypothetical protein
LFSLKSFLLLAAVNYAQKAVRMLQLDSKIMDLCEVNLEDKGYNKELIDIMLDSFTNESWSAKMRPSGAAKWDISGTKATCLHLHQA